MFFTLMIHLNIISEYSLKIFLQFLYENNPEYVVTDIFIKQIILIKFSSKNEIKKPEYRMFFAKHQRNFKLNFEQN